jgi:hypothetical protein
MNPYEPPRPPAFQPVDAQWVDYPKLAKRLRTLAIVQLVFGGLGLFGILNGLVPPGNDPMQRKLHDALWNGEIATWMRISTALGLVTALLLCGAGYMLYKQRPLGRTLTLAHAGVALVLGTISFFITRDAMAKIMEDVAKSMGPAGDIFRTTMSLAQGGGLVLGVTLYLVESYLVTRPGVKELLAQNANQ